MELERSGRPGDDDRCRRRPSMVAAPVERSEVRGHRQRSPNSAALTEGALALARAALRPLRTERSSEFGSVHLIRCPHARARSDPHRPRLRRAERPARSAWSVQRQLAARFDGEVAGGAVAEFLFRDFRFGATMELERSGRPGDDDRCRRRPSMVAAPVERSEVRGHRQRSPNSAALTEGALALARAALRPLRTERSSEFGSVHLIRCPHARARSDPHRPRLRRAERPARSAWSVQRQLAARFDGEVAGGAVANSFFVISGSGRRWSSSGRGDPVMTTDADVGLRWWRRRSSAVRYGAIDNDRQILQH